MPVAASSLAATAMAAEPHGRQCKLGQCNRRSRPRSERHIVHLPLGAQCRNHVRLAGPSKQCPRRALDPHQKRLESVILNHCAPHPAGSADHPNSARKPNDNNTAIRDRTTADRRTHHDHPRDNPLPTDGSHVGVRPVNAAEGSPSRVPQPPPSANGDMPFARHCGVPPSGQENASARTFSEGS